MMSRLRHGAAPSRPALSDVSCSIDDQIVIDESSLEFRQRQTKGNDNRPRDLPRQSPEKIPATLPSRPRQSPEKQLPSKARLSPRSGSPEKLPATLPKELPRSGSPEKQLPRESPRQTPEQLPAAFPSKPKESPRRSPDNQPRESSRPSSPEKQLPTRPKETPRLSPEHQLPSTGPRDSPRQSPEKQLPGTVSKEFPRSSPEKSLPSTTHRSAPRPGSPEKQLPKEPSPEKQLPSSAKPKELPRQAKEPSPATQLPASAPTKPRDAPKPTADKQFPEDAFFRSTVTQRFTNTTKNLNEEFITNERQPQARKPQDNQPENPDTQLPRSSRPKDEDMIDRSSYKPATGKTPETCETPETPDGGFISKSPEPEEDQKPTYRKKGLTRRETFEDRCRKILGMEEDGDTQGNYVPKPEDDVDDDDTDEQKQSTVVKQTETFEFKIEDCPDDDDEDDKPRQVTETYVIRTQPVIKVEEPLFEPESQLPQRSELTVDITESEEIETLVNTEKTTGKKMPKPVGEEVPRPAGGRKPKDGPKPQPAAGRHPEAVNPQRPSLNRQPKDDAEFVDVEEETTTITTKRSSKSPSSTRKGPLPYPEDEVESRPTTGRWPHDKVEPRPKSGRQPNDEKPQRPSTSTLSKKETELINVEEATTITTRKEPLPYSEDEDEPRPTAGRQPKEKVEPRPKTGRRPFDEEEPLPKGGRQPKDERPQRPASGRLPKEEVELLNVDEKTTTVTSKRSSKSPSPAGQEPLPSEDEEEPSPTTGRIPKDEAEFINVEEETTTTKRTSKTPVTKSPSPRRKEPLPYPEDDEERLFGKRPMGKEPTRPSTGRQPKDETEPRPAPKYYSEDVEFIKVSEDTTIVVTKRPPKSPSPTRRDNSPYPADELHPSPGKQPRDERKPSSTAGKPTKVEETPRTATARRPKDDKEPRPTPGKQPKPEAPSRQPKDDAEYISETTSVVITKRPSKSPSPTRREPLPQTETKHFVTEKIIDCNGKTVVEKISKTQRPSGPTAGPKAKKQPNDSEPEESQPKQPDSRKPSITKTETERRNSRTTKSSSTTTTSSTTNKQPLRETQPKTVKSPRKESLPRREPAKRDSLVEETRSTTTTTSTTARNTTQKDKKPSASNGSPNIKDRLRSSPRKQKPETDNVDGESSSPDTSPTRIPSERRRSSNISVHTEIIIDHTAPKTPSPKTERKVPTKVLASPARKLPVTERKESAPVPRVTRRDKDKVTRSTSENVIKVVNGKPKLTPEMSTLNPSSAQRPTERNRPSKCFTTRTINLSEQLINSEDMENVIIDIQHAKSSREPSPDRIVPTPVPAELETGKPRYPDVVQEPDDEPRKKPIVTNIPIFEEEANAYVGCQISELRNPNGIEADIHDNPTVEAPKSLDYTAPSNGQPGIDIDECLLSVHEKVSKFTHTAEQVKQPKTSTPFSRQFDEHAKVSASDECLLSIDQKVDRFLKTAENITKQPLTTPTREIERPSFEDIDEELRQDDCTLSVSQKVHKFIDTAEKLAPSAPQKSPRLVASIERHISRQSEPELEQESEPEQPSDLEPEEPLESNDDELLPMTKHHTTAIELKRQKDILNRPSVFTQRKPATPKQTPGSGKPRGSPSSSPSTVLITEERKSYRHQQSPSARSPTRSSTAPRKPSASPQPTTPGSRTTNQPTTTRSSTTAPRKPSLESPRGKPSDYVKQTETETRRTTSTTKRGEQWLHSDIDVDVEEFEPVGSQPTSPGRRTTTKPTSRSSTTAPRKPSLESPRGKPSGDYLKETETEKRRTTSTTKRGEQWLPSDVDAPNQSHSHSAKRSRPTAQTSPGRTVASRRNIFEQQSSPSPTGEPNGRRPSYMDHTKSSLEHIRRDSLEINKTHYSRKSSVEDDTGLEPRNPNAAVKFDVPRRGSRLEPARTTSSSEDIEIEEIFDLQTLEQLLETVSSYELRRRIRAQIRLIKKNMINASSTTSTTTTITSKVSPSHRQPEQLQPRSASSTPSRSPLQARRTPERNHSPEPRSSSRRTEQPDSATAHGKPPVKPRERSASPAQTRRRSPTGKANTNTTSTTTTTTRTTSKGKANEKPSPIWADRSKVLRASGSSSPTPRKGSNSSSNGLPLFGIRALKKKTQPTAPCETKQEVTGYVIEEQFYSDDKSPPRHERKELIYSSNPTELATLQQQLERASQPEDGQIKLQRELKLIDADELPLAAAIETGTRHGSVKELSERFIQKESAADEVETEDSESNDVCSVIEMEPPQMRQKSSSSTTRTSSSTRSFLNTSGEDRLVGGVDDVLERMRNADNVMEPGDSTEDREARALLNKFLGASLFSAGFQYVCKITAIAN
ncbi:titin-like [Drosophila novamexicana]|uniref:titin-like n=1 Tax=Drosophila novamexicana TaxID=47314 RepID=UPI0011E5EA62|nr:titin-like [Drosophila novamexicana]